jgi:hypothetical protein
MLDSIVPDGNIDEVAIVISWVPPLGEVFLGSPSDFEGLLNIGDTNGEVTASRGLGSFQLTLEE